jgi:uncharacterized membrane protein YqjE
MILDSLQRMLGTALAMAQVRLELLGTELELEKRRILGALLLAAFALLLIGLGLVLLCGFVVLLFWDGYRLIATATMTVLFLTAGAFLLQQAKHRMRQNSHLFATSVTELAADQADLNAPRPDGQR